MDAKPKWYKLDDQKPAIQLITSFFIIIFPGTLLFYLFALAGTLFFNTSVSEMIALPSGNIDSLHETILKYNQVVQEIALFIIPGIVLANLFRRNNESFLKINSPPEFYHLLLVVLLALFLLPITIYTGNINSRMTLPDSLSGVESWLRSKESIASDLTVLFIHSSDIPDLLLNIFILALLPSIAEEIVFRGIIQQLLCRVFRSYHSGIWVTAILFSAIHLQFFGFLPRLILGLCFGYLYFWRGNLWLPVTAHFINNLVPVIMAFYFGWSNINEKTGDFTDKQLVLPLTAVVFSSLILYYFWKEYRSKTHNLT